MVKAFSTLRAPVPFLAGWGVLLGEGVVGESLPRVDGDVLWRRRRGRLWLLLLLLLLLLVFQVDSLMPCERGGVGKCFTAVTTGVALALRVDSLVPRQRG